MTPIGWRESSRGDARICPTSSTFEVRWGHANAPTKAPDRLLFPGQCGSAQKRFKPSQSPHQPTQTFVSVSLHVDLFSESVTVQSVESWDGKRGHDNLFSILNFGYLRIQHNCIELPKAAQPESDTLRFRTADQQVAPASILGIAPRHDRILSHCTQKNPLAEDKHGSFRYFIIPPRRQFVMSSVASRFPVSEHGCTRYLSPVDGARIQRYSVQVTQRDTLHQFIIP